VAPRRGHVSSLLRRLERRRDLWQIATPDGTANPVAETIDALQRRGAFRRFDRVRRQRLHGDCFLATCGWCGYLTAAGAAAGWWWTCGIVAGPAGDFAHCWLECDDWAVCVAFPDDGRSIIGVQPRADRYRDVVRGLARVAVDDPEALRVAWAQAPGWIRASVHRDRLGGPLRPPTLATETVGAP